MQRTVRVLLRPNSEQASALTATAQQFTAAFNTVCAYGWERREKNGVTLHHQTYRMLKAKFPALVSDLHIQARVKATEAVKSAFLRQRQKRPVSCPRSQACAPRYNVHTFRLDWEARTVRLSTTVGRLLLDFRLPAYASRYTGGKPCTADLVERRGRWWLHVVVEIEAPVVSPTDKVVGVDLGLAQPAVTSHGRFLGKRGWRGIEARTFRLRRALQKKGSKSAKHHLCKLRDKQRRFRRDCDHVLSKQIVQSIPEGGTAVLENLKDIRRRLETRHGAQSRRLHSWSFAQLRSFITYKAEERGVTVAGVDPRHTSQQCSRCGHTARNNRRSRAFFVCRACGFSLHADLNGARNIAAKYRANLGNAGAGGPSVNRPIVGADEFAHHTTYKPPALAGGR
ncbi:MAG: IS200/IS605 family element transposase accessory protein TnpB [Deinococcus sp.]|nr:IS200/IS605 family element transposase accessory protein TnpB [Deinococcus sp.]